MPPRGRTDGRISPAAPERISATALGQVRRVEQQRRQRRIRDVRVDVGEGELHRLDLRVQRGLEPVVEPERDQRRRALAVRRQLAHLDTPVRQPQRLHPLGAVSRQVVLGQPARRRDRGRHLAAVEGVRALGREPAQRRRQLGQPVTAADPGRRPGSTLRQRPLVADPRRAGETALRELGRVRERLGQTEAPEALGQIRPGPDRSRHGHRPRPVQVVALPLQVGG